MAQKILLWHNKIIPEKYNTSQGFFPDNINLSHPISRNACNLLIFKDFLKQYGRFKIVNSKRQFPSILRKVQLTVIAKPAPA